MAHGLKVETSGGILQLDSSNTDDYLNVLDGGTASTFSANLSNDLVFVKLPNPSSGTTKVYGLVNLSKTFSTTTLTIGTGNRTLTIGTGLSYPTGDTATISNSAGSMVGTVSSYNSITGSLTVNVTTSEGSGTYSSWSVAITDGSPDFAIREAAPGATTNITVDYRVVGPNKNGTTDTNQTYGLQLYDSNSNITFDTRKFDINSNLEPSDRFEKESLSGQGVLGEDPTQGTDSRLGDLGLFVNMNWSVIGTSVSTRTACRGVEVSNSYVYNSGTYTGTYYVDRAIFFGNYTYRENVTEILLGETFST